MKALAPEFRAYTWAPPSDEVAAPRRASTPRRSSATTRTRRRCRCPRRGPARSPARSPSISSYPPGGYHELRERDRALQRRRPRERRARRRRRRPDPPLRPLLRRPRRHDRDPGARRRTRSTGIAAQLARRRGRRRRPGRSPSPAGRTAPTASCAPLPDARPLVVDEAYFEYCGETAIPLLDDDVIVLRTFSKAFGARRRADRLRARRARTSPPS